MAKSASKLNLINFGFNPWSHFWKRNQTITYMLGNMDLFDKVLFINSGVWLGNLLRNYGQEFSHPQINKWKAIFPLKVARKFTAFTLVHFPFKDKIGWIKKANSHLNSWVFHHFTKKPFVLILNDPQEFTKKLASKFLKESEITIFDWSDDFTEFSSNPLERKITEDICQYYCLKSDIVLTINQKLTKKAKKLNDKSFTIKNATNYFTFSDLIDNKVKVPVNKIKRPVIGYIGWLNSLRLDLELIFHIVSKRPNWQFVFMGPQSENYPLGKIIPKMPNVHIRNPVPYIKYLAYLNSLDVCILPNKINAHTEGNDPIKIYDYLASGNPVVTTPTAGTENFREHIMCAENKNQFLHCLDLAIEEHSKESRKRRQAVARRHSWQERIKEIYTIIDPLLAGQGML